MHQQAGGIVLRERSTPSGRPPGAALPTQRSTYLPGLDGLRALAVCAVLLYHVGAPFAPGGFLGVDVFFAISGYLISSQLWARWSLRGPGLRAFWAARVRRLFPAVLLLIAGCTVAMLVAGRDQLGVFGGDVAAAATYTSNWWYILHERSYFEATGRPPVLQHLWSLAVEEQFYLLWPLVVAAVLRSARPLRSRRLALCYASLGLAVASAVVMGVGSALAGTPERGDPSRWYFGTDSHATALLLGAALAFRRGGAGFGPLMPTLPPASRRATAVGAAAVAALAVLVMTVEEYDAALYRVGFAGVAVLAVLATSVVARPGPLQELFSGRLVRYVGRRSYGLYLWHWPVVAFTRPELDLPWSGLRVLVLRLTLTVVLAELSYRLVEEPVRRHGWRGAWAGVRGRRDLARLACAQLVLGLTVALVIPPQVAVPSWRLPGLGGAGRDAVPAVPKPTPSLSPSQVVPRKDLAVTVYGDSVALGARPALRTWLGSVTNHAQQAQHSWTMLPGVVADARAGRIHADVVVIHTGDNGLVPEEELRAALDALAGVPQVVLVTPKVPRGWEARAVATIRAVEPDYRNVQLADWHEYAAGHPEWFADDGVHLIEAGREAYVRLLLSRLTIPVGSRPSHESGPASRPVSMQLDGSCCLAQWSRA